MNDVVERFNPCNTEACKKRCDSFGVRCKEICIDEIESLRQRVNELEAKLAKRNRYADEIVAEAVEPLQKELAALKRENQHLINGIGQGEPVAYIHKWKLHAATMGKSLSFRDRSPHGDDMEIIPLYTSPTIPEGKMLIETAFLKMVSESLGRFVSDEGWAQHDIDVMDDLDTRIAAAPKPEDVK